MKKRFIGLVLTMSVILSMNLGVSVSATSSSDNTTITHASVLVNELKPRADEYEYYHKFEGDYIWERKWNITRGYWMTDWYIIAVAS